MKKWSVGLAAALFFSLPVAHATEKGVRITPEGVYYTVSRNETLSSISLKFTGDIRHWQKIGNTNRIENDRTIPVGRVVLIPATLLAPVAAFARIGSFFGDVLIHDQAGNRLETRIDAMLKEGDTVATMAESFLSLILEDGSQITLPPDSALNLRTLRTTQYVRSPRTQLFLEKGRVESSVTPFSKHGSRYEVLSPVAVSGVRGTRFRVQYREDRAFNEVLSGKVAVKPQSRDADRVTQLVAAGYGSVVGQQRATRPIALLPAPALADGYALQQRLPLQFVLTQTAAQSFQLRVSTDAQGVNNIAEVSVKADQGKALARLADLPDGHYFAHVHAVDANGLAGLQQTVPFEVAARPFAPFLIAPQAKYQGNADSTAHVPITMRWSLSGNIVSYRLQIAGDKQFEQRLVDQVVAAGEQDGHLAVSLQPGAYQWRVASIDGAGKQGPFTDARAVQVLAGLAAPAGSVNEKELHFSWSASAPGQRFTFQLATDPSFTTLVHDVTTEQPEVKLPRPQAGTYYARVRSIDSDGFVGTYSPAQRFVVPLLWQTDYGTPLDGQGQPLGTSF
ncbi:FecR domain-containing protein [uncultured Oxalicibacterium sp.]|uniref:FecR domain-containing protein n=1 Tax=uncultured Oxalicibacterium sp. TaxID=1168540 RepID=UPI0025F416DE|nr:FecR domain-containing protein [uncultured Oxalicibacterium sp.]